MKELKITIDQLKNYLGTGLMLEYSGFGEDKKSIVDKWSISIHEHHDIHFNHSDYGFDDDVLFYFKPICYRLSDLDKEIEHNGERFVPLDRIKDYWKSREDYDSTIDLDGSDFCIEVAQRGCDYTDERPDTTAYLFTSTVFQIYKWLFEWHFWPFGDTYFEQGLVIDKMKNNKK